MVDDASFVGGFARNVLADWKDGCHLHALRGNNTKRKRSSEAHSSRYLPIASPFYLLVLNHLDPIPSRYQHTILTCMQASLPVRI